MSIADFKNGTTPRIRPPRVGQTQTPRLSLVNGVVIRTGRGPEQLFTYSDGRTCKHPDGDKHDCFYVDARNLLIPRAEQLAHERYDKDKPMSHAREFMRAMTELAREKGLIK